MISDSTLDEKQDMYRQKFEEKQKEVMKWRRENYEKSKKKQ